MSIASFVGVQGGKELGMKIKIFAVEVDRKKRNEIRREGGDRNKDEGMREADL